jgi:hypothetical protein
VSERQGVARSKRRNDCSRRIPFAVLEPMVGSLL